MLSWGSFKVWSFALDFFFFGFFCSGSFGFAGDCIFTGSTSFFVTTATIGVWTTGFGGVNSILGSGFFSTFFYWVFYCLGVFWDLSDGLIISSYFVSSTTYATDTTFYVVAVSFSLVFSSLTLNFFTCFLVSFTSGVSNSVRCSRSLYCILPM